MRERYSVKLMPQVVLGVAAHPDDLDFVAAGAMAGWAAAGADVCYLVLTDGSKGTEDRDIPPAKLIEQRREEQLAAGKILGLKEVLFLDYPDGMLENSLDVKRDVARAIRRLRPDVMVTNDPSVLYSADSGYINHPDHRAAGQAVLDAAYPLARDHLSFPELMAEGFEPHKVRTVLLSNFEQQNFGVDISETLDVKLKALAKHKSQIPDWEATQSRVTRWAVAAGKKYGCRYAEAFVRIDIA
ncbi:MAG TPA: PIG-L deacetylase family protein [Candidatus Saccharimonadia bacterium]|jgi:LmbE family N-acetylglucosaminyl deacetylase